MRIRKDESWSVPSKQMITMDLRSRICKDTAQRRRDASANICAAWRGAPTWWWHQKTYKDQNWWSSTQEMDRRILKWRSRTAPAAATIAATAIIKKHSNNISNVNHNQSNNNSDIHTRRLWVPQTLHITTLWQHATGWHSWVREAACHARRGRDTMKLSWLHPWAGGRDMRWLQWRIWDSAAFAEYAQLRTLSKADVPWTQGSLCLRNSAARKWRSRQYTCCWRALAHFSQGHCQTRQWGHSTIDETSIFFSGPLVTSMVMAVTVWVDACVMTNLVVVVAMYSCLLAFNFVNEFITRSVMGSFQWSNLMISSDCEGGLMHYIHSRSQKSVTHTERSYPWIYVRRTFAWRDSLRTCLWRLMGSRRCLAVTDVCSLTEGM